jgi:hypothetical protein
MMNKKLVAFLFCVCGLLLHLYTLRHWHEGGKDIYMLGQLITATSCVPYLVVAILAIFNRTCTVALGAVIAVLLTDLVMHYLVYIDPRGTTAAIGQFFLAIYNLLLIGPAGGLLAWWMNRKTGHNGKQIAGMPTTGGITPA